MGYRVGAILEGLYSARKSVNVSESSKVVKTGQGLEDAMRSLKKGDKFKFEKDGWADDEYTFREWAESEGLTFEKAVRKYRLKVGKHGDLYFPKGSVGVILDDDHPGTEFSVNGFIQNFSSWEGSGVPEYVISSDKF